MSPPVEEAPPAVVSKVTSVSTWVAPSKAMAPPSVVMSAETTEAPLTPKPAPPLAVTAKGTFVTPVVCNERVACGASDVSTSMFPD